MVEKLAPLLNKLKPREVLYRYDSPVARYYYRMIDGQEIPYMGVSYAVELLTHSDFSSFDRRYGALAGVRLAMLSTYGTLLHTEIATFHRTGRLNFTEVAERAAQRAIANHFEFELESWRYHLPRDLASWLRFCEERNVEVLAVEYPVWADEWQIATLIDMYCELNFNGTRQRAIINIKKGNTDKPDADDEPRRFYENHDCQLQIERLLWESSVPEEGVDLVFNWAPNNWLKEPTYTLKNWTEKTRWGRERLLECLPAVKYDFDPPRKLVTLEGEYTGNVADNIVEVRISPQDITLESNG